MVLSWRIEKTAMRLFLLKIEYFFGGGEDDGRKRKQI